MANKTSFFSGSGVTANQTNAIQSSVDAAEADRIAAAASAAAAAASSTAAAASASTANTIATTGTVAAVAGAITNINTVAGKQSEIGLLGTSATVEDLNLLGTSAVVADLALLGTSAVVEDLSLLATPANVAAMAQIGTSAVVEDLALLGSAAVVEDLSLLGSAAVVADMDLLANSTTIANMGQLGTASAVADLALLGTSAIVTDMDLLATSANVTNMNTLGASGVVSNIAAVAGVASTMSAAATNASNAAQSAIAAAASQVAASQSAASAATTYDTFDDRYLGAKSGFAGAGTGPSVDNDGNALVEGALFFSSAANEMRVFDGSGFIAASAAGSVSINTFRYTATAGQTTFSGNDEASNALAYTVGNILLSLNGVLLEIPTDAVAVSGTSIVLQVAAELDDEINITVFKSFTTADMVSATTGGTHQALVNFSAGINVTGNIAASGTVDGVDIAARDGVLSSTVTTANAALPKSGGALTGALTTNSTIDGRDVAADGVTADAALPKAGGALTGNVTFGDGNRAIFGADTDMQLFHNGSSGTIANSTGSLVVRTDAFRVLNAANSEQILHGDANGAVTLYHDNAPKLATTSTGISVTGALAATAPNANGNAVFTRSGTSESLTIGTFYVSANGNDLQLTTTANATIDAGGETSIDSASSGILRLKVSGTNFGTFFHDNNHMYIQSQISDGHMIFRGKDAGNTITALTLDMENAGAATFNAGATFADNVGIGCTPSYKLDVASTVQIRAGESLRLQNAAGSSAATVQCAGAGGNSDLGFSTAGSERMRITSGGTVIAGGTGAVSHGQANLFQVGEGGNFFTVQRNASLNVLELNTKCNTATGRTHFAFNNSNGTVGTIQTSGSGTAYNTSSDYRLKENVVYDWDATTRLKQLKPARFNFIADANKTVDGFLAHEAQAVVPECVTGAKDEVKVWQNGEELPDGVSVGDNKLDTDGNTIPEMQGIDQAKLVPLLVKTILELEARITALEG
jgi:hypothetical protein